MEKKEDPRSKFKVIPGGRCSEITVGSVRIVPAPPDQPPFPVEAVVFEEDTYLVLSADSDRIEMDDHPVVILTEALEAEPERPGSVVVREDAPLRFLAVIHDLDQDPSWREEWIRKALEGIFQEGERRNLHSIELPFLGTKYGSLPKACFLRLLREFLEQSPFLPSLRVWLVLPGDTGGDIIDWIEPVLKGQGGPGPGPGSLPERS
jgi:hypothetical protein